MAPGFPSLHLSTWIARDFAQVYDFLRRPENFPRWAAGLAKGLTPVPDGADESKKGAWIGQGPDGPIRVRFAPRNEHGVVDHWVTLADGQVISVPLRVIANSGGSEVVLTLFRLPQMSDAIFARDADWVRRDLATLKNVLES
jgi:hypothetical protein